MLAAVLPPLLEPVRELLADLVDRQARFVERPLHALAVVGGGTVGLVAQGRLVAAPQVLAADDPVVLAAADPCQQLADALDRQGVGDLEVLEEPRQPLEPRALL